MYSSNSFLSAYSLLPIRTVNLLSGLLSISRTLVLPHPVYSHNSLIVKSLFSIATFLPLSRHIGYDSIPDMRQCHFLICTCTSETASVNIIKPVNFYELKFRLFLNNPKLTNSVILLNNGINYRINRKSPDVVRTAV